MSADDERFSICGVREVLCLVRHRSNRWHQLKPCSKCDLVEYCSDQCQKDHLQEHEPICKERAAELYDELLFKQPESSHLGDCPICFLPIPSEADFSRVKACCGQIICAGCMHAHFVAGRVKEIRCPFCRHLTPETNEESEKLHMERAESNDPIALARLGSITYGRGDYERAVHYCYWSRAAALGDVDSMHHLATMYRKGEGVEEDRVKERALLETAAIAGHPGARYNLGCCEANYCGRFDRAVKHWIISAALGFEYPIKALKECYKEGHVSKDYTAALRAYQAAVDAARSPQRQAVKAWEACCNEQNASK